MFLQTLERSSYDLAQDHKSCQKGSFVLENMPSSMLKICPNCDQKKRNQTNEQQTQITVCIFLVDIF